MNVNTVTGDSPARVLAHPFLSQPRTLDALGYQNGPRGLAAHLRAWLGAGLPAEGFRLVVWSGHDEPGWDGQTAFGQGIESPDGTLLSLSPTVVADARVIDRQRVAAALGAPDAAITVPAALGRPDLHLGRAVFRWSEQPARLPEAGEWVETTDPRLPAWLRPFNGGVLVAWDERGRYAAGVGVKRHNRHAHELAVATDPAHRGRGLARLLVAQAAWRIMDQGALPLYLHETGNPASARVAEAAGFPDRGWRVLNVLPAPRFHA